MGSIRFGGPVSTFVPPEKFSPRGPGFDQATNSVDKNLKKSRRAGNYKARADSFKNEVVTPMKVCGSFTSYSL